MSKMLAAMSVVCRRGREVSRIRQSSCISVTVETAIFTGSGVFKLARVKLESYRRHVQVVRALAIQILSALMQPANAEHAKLLGIWRMSILPCYVRPTHNNRGKLCVQNAPTAEFCDRFNAFSPCQNIASWCVRKLRETASLMGGNTLGALISQRAKLLLQGKVQTKAARQQRDHPRELVNFRHIACKRLWGQPSGEANKEAKAAARKTQKGRVLACKVNLVRRLLGRSPAESSKGADKRFRGQGSEARTKKSQR